jgi:hypothetical protein
MGFYFRRIQQESRKRKIPPWCLSLDLTAATDTFSKDILKGFIEVYKEHLWDRCPYLAPLAELVTVDIRFIQTTDYSSKPEAIANPKRECLSLRGSPMAQPSNWILLNNYREFCRDCARFLSREVHNGRISEAQAFSNIQDGTIWDSEWFCPEYREYPFGIGCGDDDLSLGSLRFCHFFEAFLRALGGEISEGSHFRSRSYGIFTENPYSFSKEKGLYYIDTVKIKSLTTPDTRMPGQKEVPVLWNRGSAVSSAVRNLIWTPEDRVLRACLLTQAYWRYYRFIARLIDYGIPIHMDKSLGGWGLDHYQGKNLSKTPGYYRRALKVLFRDDQSLDSLLKTSSLAAIWSPRSWSTLGKISQELTTQVLHEVDRRGGVTSIRSLLDRQLILIKGTPAGPLKYLDRRGLTTYLRQVPEWVPFSEALKEVQGKIRGRLVWWFPGDQKTSSPPSLRALGKALKGKCEEILKLDPGSAKRSTPLCSKDLIDRNFWRTNVVLIKRETLDEVLFGTLEDYVWELIYRSFPEEL